MDFYRRGVIKKTPLFLYRMDRVSIVIFNPEHDLCLANGNPHFVPPSSALLFAEQGAEWMCNLKRFHPVDFFTDAAHAGQIYYRQCVDTHCEADIYSWGWNTTLKTFLIKSGIPPEILPEDGILSSIRALSHRSTALPLQKDTYSALCLDDIDNYMRIHHNVVLKAPWSGSGRGIRWVDMQLSSHDKSWISKILSTQKSVLIEPKFDVVQDFAFLFYYTQQKGCTFVGYSLFKTQNGVYRGNKLLYDIEISEYLSQWIPFEEITNAQHTIQNWLNSILKDTNYQGPIGVDAFIYRNQGIFKLRPCVEINFRYTMGFIAHELLLYKPELYKSTWSPMSPSPYKKI